MKIGVRATNQICNEMQCNRCLGFRHTERRDCGSEAPASSKEASTAPEGACGTPPAVAQPRLTVFGPTPI